MRPIDREALPRVGYVLKKFPRLSETFILRELLSMERAGVPVTIYSLRTPDAEPVHAQLRRLRAPVRYLPPAANKRDEDELAALLAPMVTHDRVEHLHAHFMSVAARVCAAVRRRTGLPFTVTAHAKDVYRTSVDPAAFSSIAAEAKALVTVCDSNRRYIAGRLAPTARIERIYNGAAVPGAAVPLERDPRLVLGVGRLVEKKGFEVLLDACARLRRAGTDFRCVIVGDGDRRGALERRAARMDLPVTFTGSLPQEQTLTLMRRAQVLAAPCVHGEDGNQDALPTVLIEAMSLGLPSISTPVGGIGEIVTSGREGLLVPERDADALASALSQTLTDRRGWRDMATEGPASARRFDPAHAADQLLDVFAGS